MISSFINVHYCYVSLINQMSVGLLMYAHLPAALLAIFFGIFILSKTKNIIGVTFFTMCICFAMWCFLSLCTWFAFNSAITMFTWSLIDLFGLTMFFFSYYFLYTFITDKDLPNWQKITSLLLLLPTAIWTFMGQSLTLFNSNDCTAIENDLVVRYPYFVEAIFIFAVLIFVFSQYRKTKDSILKKKIVLTGSGIAIFLIFFFSATLFVKILSASDASAYVYNYEIYGLFGMPILLAFLVYIVVKFKAFDIKLIGAQALVWALIILIGSEFLFVNDLTNQILVGVTLVISSILGLNLVSSVKKEIAQKELLEIANNDKSEFMSFASHQIRTPLTAIKGLAANTLEGDYGSINDEVKDIVQKILVCSNDVVALIGQYLNKSKMELGQIGYDFQEFDLAEIVKQTVKGFEPNAEQAKLALKFSTDGASSYLVNADRGKIKEVVGNLVDNAIKYTQLTSNGFVEVSVSRKNDKILIKILDNGKGMDDEAKTKLFKKFSRAKDASTTNDQGHGLGLFLVKTFVDAQKGRVWGESEGVGKGSTFIVELPIKQTSKKEI